MKPGVRFLIEEYIKIELNTTVISNIFPETCLMASFRKDYKVCSEVIHRLLWQTSIQQVLGKEFSYEVAF